jgi:hypothetical protein
MKLKPGRTALAALIPIILVTLTACTPTVALDPAANATAEGCAEIIVRLPKNPPTVGNLAARETDAQGTAAWGDPVGVILRCGVTPPGPSTLPCYTVNGVDWLEDSSGAPNYVFTTFGRNPAVEVIVDSKLASGTNSLNDLSNAVGTIPATKRCLSAEEVLPGTNAQVPGSSISPSPSPASSN